MSIEDVLAMTVLLCFWLFGGAQVLREQGMSYTYSLFEWSKVNAIIVLGVDVLVWVIWAFTHIVT